MESRVNVKTGGVVSTVMVRPSLNTSDRMDSVT